MGNVFLAAALAVVAAWLLHAHSLKATWSISWGQSLLLSVLRLLFRARITHWQDIAHAEGPVIFMLSRQSSLDALMMLALLPAQTEHLFEGGDETSPLIAPFRRLSRQSGNEGLTSRARLSASLLRNGMTCVYVDRHIEPSQPTLQAWAEIAEIARDSGATIIPVHVRGSRLSLFSAWEKDKAPRQWLPRITIAAGTPYRIDTQTGPAMADRILDGLAEAKFNTVDLDQSLFQALVSAARQQGTGVEILEDAMGGKLSWRRLMAGARVFADRIADMTEPGEAVGVLLPNANGVVVTLIALFSSGRVAAMLNYTSGSASIASAIQTGKIRLVLSSHSFIEKAELEPLVAAIEDHGTGVIYVEDIRDAVTGTERLSGMMNWSRPLVRRLADDPAVMLFTSGSEGTPKGVVLSSANLIANAGQADCRIDISPADRLFNVLPVFHSFGLLGGTLLPLLYGVKLFLYPSPLHYKLIPAVARKIKPTIMFGTDTFLSGYGRAAKDGDFDSLRLIVAGAEAVKPETRRIFRERFGADIVEGYGMTEAAPVVAVNSSTHALEGSVGRLMPGMDLRLEPVDGIAEGGRMHVKGPNVMLGYMLADNPGVLVSPAGAWHDSGDIVSLDQRGFITIKGRAKRFAKIAGEMVSLGAVEMMVQSLWPEAQHAAITLPDRRKGERIVLVTTKMPALKDELQAHSRRFGATDLMVPNDIVSVDAIPVLGSGKTDYSTMQKMASERIAPAA